MPQYYVVHSRNGRVGQGTDSRLQSLDDIVAALQADSRGHLVLHFHGGLVSKAAGLASAGRLAEKYGTVALPVFYVWETGFFETLRNNLLELAEEPVFKQLVRKLLQYALDRLGGQNGGRSIMPGSVDAREIRNAVDDYWSNGDKEHVPYRNFEPVVGPTTARSASNMIDADEIQADLEQDAEFRSALATLPDLQPGSRSVLTSKSVPEHRSLFSEAIADRVSEQPGSRGLITWFKVALLVKNILVKVMTRYSRGRDHGLYATVVEEIVREVSIGGSGINEWGKALQWNRMKQDTADAFGTDPECAGTALLTRLATAFHASKSPKRITLIGHSTGAIYIANWLAAADTILPQGIKVDVVFLAPAITYEFFDQVLARFKSRIGNFRLFAMRDALERDDQVLGEDDSLGGGRDWKRFVYPSSLLYLVSGVLESRKDRTGKLIDAPDMPLLGMERFFANHQVYAGEDFADVERVRTWLNSVPHSTVWSNTSGQADGLNSMCIDHGRFNEEEVTLQSVLSVLRGW